MKKFLMLIPAAGAASAFAVDVSTQIESLTTDIGTNGAAVIGVVVAVAAIVVAIGMVRKAR